MNKFDKRLADIKRRINASKQEYDVTFQDGSHSRMDTLALLLYTISASRGDGLQPYIEYKAVHDQPDDFPILLSAVEQLRKE